MSTLDLDAWPFSTPLGRVVFAARCYASAALAVTRCLSVCMSVRVSVTFVHSAKTNKHIFKIFPPSGSHTILVFCAPYVIAVFQRGPLNGGVACRLGRQNSRFLAFTVCCQRCNWPGDINTTTRTTVPQVVILIAGGKRWSLLMAGDDDEMFITRSLNVTPKATEQRI